MESAGGQESGNGSHGFQRHHAGEQKSKEMKQNSRLQQSLRSRKVKKSKQKGRKMKQKSRFRQGRRSRKHKRKQKKRFRFPQEGEQGALGNNKEYWHH